MIHKKVALGMSGGVDSSVAAHLLLAQGYDVTGVYLECWRAPGCRTEEDRKDALKVALDLGINFQVLDFKQAYKDKVVEYFFNSYQAGQTPNPDVLCNKEIKFGLFYDWAMANSFDYVATGHYASINKSSFAGEDFLTLQIPKDTHKDQTYFLYRLNQNQLAHIIFPLQELTKPEVRDLAVKKNLVVATKKDSVGICFIGDINVGEFLKERLGEKPGKVVDTKGNVIGTHRGLWFYTVGQRHGFEIDKKTLVTASDGSQFTKENIPPFYVIDKNPTTNQLIVGFGSETLTQEFAVSNPHNIYSELDFEKLTKSPLLVRIRHTGALLPCHINKQDTNTLYVTLETPVQGIAVGQSAVLYLAKDDTLICLGGGDIASFSRYTQS
jgi:tRNA-specific 2-thiouridylase